MKTTEIAARALEHQARMGRAGVHVSTSQAVCFVEREAKADRASLAAAGGVQFAEEEAIDPATLERLARAYQATRRARGEREPTREEATAAIMALWDMDPDETAPPKGKPGVTATLEQLEEGILRKLGLM